jgi:Ca2+/Na+ antiporter
MIPLILNYIAQNSVDKYKEYHVFQNLVYLVILVASAMQLHNETSSKGEIFTAFYILFWITSGTVYIINSFKVFANIPSEVFYNSKTYNIPSFIISMAILIWGFVCVFAIQYFGVKYCYMYIIPCLSIVQVFAMYLKLKEIQREIHISQTYLQIVQKCIENLIILRDTNKLKMNLPFLPKAIKLYSAVVQNINMTPQQTCNICLADYMESDLVALLSCKHIFHYICIENWQKDCPTCRAPLEV